MKSPFVRVLLLIAALALVRPPLSAQEPDPLHPGDAVRIVSSMEETLSGTFAVDEGGTIVLPLLGERSITGIPAQEVKRALQRDYRERLGEHHSVEITLLRRVRVLGAVKNPGIYHVDPTMGLNDVLALAGGASREGNAEDVRIVRGQEEIRAGGRLRDGSGGAIRSGDEIVVPERSWITRNAAVMVGATISAVAIIVSRILE